MLIVIYIFLSFTLISGVALVFIVRSQFVHIEETSQNRSFLPNSVRSDMYKLAKRIVVKFWEANSHKIEKVFIWFARLGGKFEKLVLCFVDFVWGKHKIERNGNSKYWNEIIDHKNGLSKEE